MADRISLFKRLLEGELSPAETQALIEWLGSDETDAATRELILQQLQKTPAQPVDPAVIHSLEAKLPFILQAAENEQAAEAPVRRLRWMRYAAAAIICFGIAAYFLFFNKSSRTDTGVNGPVATSQLDITPGKDGAILTLDDGSTVVLDSLGNGIVTTKDGAKVLLQNGQLIYQADKNQKSEIAYNTMSTPKGRQFKLVLQDGTQVWLNAASSIRYPIVFTGKERRVEVTGEVYFEVAPATMPAGKGKLPFVVSVNNETEVEVLGTHFNINAYKNEATVNTTLLEGAVRIINNEEAAILKPGQQAQVKEGIGQVNGGGDKRIKVLNDVNTEKVMAWKNGKFDFEDATLEEVMRQLERWYDVEVIYEKGVPKLEFMGRMGRDLTLAEVIRGLEMSKVRCRIEEGRKLVVMP